MISRPICLLSLVLLLQPPSPRFRSGIDVVEVDVSVMRGGAAVPGLTADNFALTDNGVPQRVTSVRLDQVPVNVVMVLDVSESMTGVKLGHLIDAGLTLLGHLRTADRAALVTFSEAVRVPLQLTADKEQAKRTIGALEPRGATAMFDALHVGLLLAPRDTTRTLVLLFTDGQDNYSWIPPRDAIDEARRAGTVIHAIELRAPEAAQDAYGRRVVERTPATALAPLAAASGGRFWSAYSSRDLQALFTRALDEMRARYLLTFTPTGVPQPGWHDLKVTLKNARGEVTARPAYFVEPTSR